MSFLLFQFSAVSQLNKPCSIHLLPSNKTSASFNIFLGHLCTRATLNAPFLDTGGQNRTLLSKKGPISAQHHSIRSLWSLFPLCIPAPI